MKKSSMAAAALSALGLVGITVPAHAASFFTSETVFNTAAAPYGARTTESYESAPGPASTSTSLDYAPITFSCTGSTYCPGFFGQSTFYATDGTHSVFGATPDSMTFTFSSAITAFATDLIGLGDVGATTFSALLSNGSSGVLFTDLSQGPGTVNFVGIVDAAGFTSVTFTGTRSGDGVFYDRTQYAMSAAVPEPETYALMLMGLGVMGYVARRRKA